ncbi:MAG: V-type ATP synthase subunit E [Atopobiaceae bacterium]|jgi:V/A-type H+-transporting ATPase subunit E
MAGIDAITSEILQDAEKSAQEVLAEARAEAESALASARASVEKTQDQTTKRLELEKQQFEKRVESRKQMIEGQQKLAYRQHLIESVLDQAQQELHELPAEKYFDMILKLVAQHAEAADGEIQFSAADIKRLPAGFEAKLNEAAKTAGGTLKVSQEAVNIADGFVLRYGGIDENCTLDALFSQLHDEMQDAVLKTLWQA